MAAIATRYEVVIGIEVHAQLLTKSKMFCSCSKDYFGSPVNSHVCPYSVIDKRLPVLPSDCGPAKIRGFP